MELDHLPDEVLVEIFLFLAPSDRSVQDPYSSVITWPKEAGKIALCCHRWYNLVMEHNDKLMWANWHDYAQRSWVQDEESRWELQDYRERCIIRNKGKHRKGAVSRQAVVIPHHFARKIRDREDLPYRKKIETMWQMREHIYWKLVKWESKRTRLARIGWSFCLSLDMGIMLLAVGIVLNLIFFLVTSSVRDLIIRGMDAPSTDITSMLSHITYAPLWINIVMLPPILARVIAWGIRTKCYHLVLYLPMSVYAASFVGVWLGVVYLNELLPPFARGPWALVFLPIYVACLSALVVIPIACYYHSYYIGDDMTARTISCIVGGGLVATWNMILISAFVTLAVTQLHLSRVIPVAVTYLPLYLLEGTNLILVVIWCFIQFKSRKKYAEIVLLGLAIGSLPISHVASSVLGTFSSGAALLVLPLVSMCMAMIRPIWTKWREEQDALL